MYKRKSISEHIRVHLLASAAIVSPFTLSQAVAAEDNASAEETEVISVTGVRNSLKEAAFLKKNANQIMDAISAEDIGQLPDANIAEALQRVTGIQIGRDETGAGSGFQVRGLSQNRVEINGQDMASGGEERSNSFSAVDSSLFKGIEVIKSPTADMVEGALGATVRLKTFKPLDFKKPTVNASAEYNKNSLADDNGSKFTLMGTTKFETDNLGEFGVLVNLSRSERATETHILSSDWAPVIGQQTEGSDLAALAIYRPDNIDLQRKPFAEKNDSIDTAIQWQLNEDLEFTINAQRSEFSRNNLNQRLRFQTNNRANTILARNSPLTERDDSPVFLEPFNRPVEDNWYIRTDEGDETRGILPTYEKLEGDVSRYVLVGGTVAPVTTGFSTPVNSGYNINEETLIQENYGFTMNYVVSDNLLMEFQYALGQSERLAEGYGLTMDIAGQTEFDEDLNSSTNDAIVKNTFVYFEYGDYFPELGFVTTQEGVDNDNLQSTLIDPANFVFTNFSGATTKNNNKKNSLTVDFDWIIDGDNITTVEFGARVASNNINRSRQQLRFGALRQYSIFSNWWRRYDRDLTTGSIDDFASNTPRPTLAWIDQVMEEETGQANYMSQYIDVSGSLFPDTNGADILPTWSTPTMSIPVFKQMIEDFFPGRAGDCQIIDRETLCNQNITYPDGVVVENEEFDHILEIPKSQLFTDGNYPYLIEEKTKAAYVKVNFEGELANIPYVGNAGIRYVTTETETLGIRATRFADSQGRVLKDTNGFTWEDYTTVSVPNSYSNVLPSFNINFMLSDDMFLRFAAADAMTRANPSDLSPSLNIPNASISGTAGNPLLKPEEARSFDVSWEWYMSDVNSLSAAYFHKQLSNFHLRLAETIFITRDAGLEPYTLTSKRNGGDGTIDGIELAASHAMDYLPGFLSGFGIQANYTFTTSEQESGKNQLTGEDLPVFSLSENSYNFILFYDKYGFNFRAAYNYRDESLSGLSKAGIDPIGIYERDAAQAGTALEFKPTAIELPIWRDSFETLDLSASYRYGKTTFFIQATNVLNEPTRDYVGFKDTTKNLLRTHRETGATYKAGIRVRFN